MDAVAAEVVTELQKTSLPLEAQACMGALSAGELGAWTRSWSPFRCLFGFVQWTGDLSQFPTWSGAIVTITLPDGTRKQVTTHAAGAWQDEPATWGDVVAANPGIRFDAQGQIAGNWWLAQRDFRSHTGLSLLSQLQLGNLSTVATALFSTWPGGADADFPQIYAVTLAVLRAITPPPPPPPPQPSDPAAVLAALQVQLNNALAALDARQAEIDRLKASDPGSVILTSLQATIAAFAAALLQRGVTP